MARSFINCLKVTLIQSEQFIISLFGPKFPPGSLCSIGLQDHGPANAQAFGVAKSSPSLTEMLKEAIVWGVPKHRRSLEKRMTRKFGTPGYNWKPLVPKNLLTCPACGHPHEPLLLCNNCYKTVKAETKEIQEAIEQNLGLEPVEQNIVVLYEGEKELKGDDYWKDQRTVELPKKRPAWFHSNLMQPTTQEPADSNNIKPEQLA